MLESVRLVNFKSHVDTTVELGRMTVLVGPNACGKTSVLDGLELLAALARVSALDAFGGQLERIHRTTRQGSKGINLSARGADGTSFEAEVPSQDLSPPQVTRIASELGGRSGGNGRPPDMPKAKAMLSVRCLKPSAERLASPSRTETLPPTMERNGTGIASLLAHLKLSEEPTYDAIVSDLQAVLPRVRGVRIDRDMGGGGVREVVVFDFEDARGVRAEMASAGTILALGILTAVHADPKPRILLLDDVEQGLHPRAQVDLARVLLRILKERPDLQIIATTHSPYFLDEIAPKDVRVMALDSAGAPHVARLSDHPDAQHALQALTTGEFFSAESEDWVLERVRVDA